MAGRKRMTETDRFLSHVAKSESGCWLWTAYKLPSGYGNFRTPSRHELAHRASYRLFCGPLEADKDVMHSCDTPSCVNPAHLSLGTRRDNMRDAQAKGRTARGMSHGRRKIDENAVRLIRASPKIEREIAEQFGITQGHVNAIRSGKRWANLALENENR